MRPDKKLDKQYGVFVKHKTTSKELLAGLYDLLERFPVFLPVLNSILKRYRVYLNGDTKECTARAIGCLLKIYAASAVTVCIVFLPNPSIYTFLSAVFLIYFFYMEFVMSSVTKLELSFLRSFDSFLSTVRHYYYKCGSVKDALVVAEGESDVMMRGHIKEMLKCLNSKDQTSEINSYLNSGYNKYLKLYLTLSKFVEENGDVEDEKGSVYLNACMHLKIDIEEEKRFISEKRHRFSGFMYTAVIPIIAIPFIEMWGTSTISSLKIFYYGYTGTIIRVFLLTVSFVCYNALLELRDGERLKKKKHMIAAFLASLRFGSKAADILIGMNRKKSAKIREYIKRLCENYKIKTFYILKLLYFIIGLNISLVMFTVGHSRSASIYKYDITEVTEMVQLADSRQIQAMEKLIPEYVANIIDRDLYISKERLTEDLLNEKDIKSGLVAEKAADEIIKRVELYKAEHLEIKDVLFSILIALILFKFPDMALTFKNALIEGKIKDEIMQFQSIVHMLKKVPGVSTVSLLNEMERFSQVFKPVIRQCINEYNISDEAALMRLYEAERYPEWKRLFDCFLMADELGIEDSFEEISTEIENFRENRKLDRKILLDNEGMLGAIVAVLPGGLILFGYLLCPFMIRSLEIFNEYQAGITMY